MPLAAPLQHAPTALSQATPGRVRTIPYGISLLTGRQVFPEDLDPGRRALQQYKPHCPSCRGALTQRRYQGSRDELHFMHHRADGAHRVKGCVYYDAGWEKEYREHQRVLDAQTWRARLAVDRMTARQGWVDAGIDSLARRFVDSAHVPPEQMATLPKRLAFQSFFGLVRHQARTGRAVEMLLAHPKLHAGTAHSARLAGLAELLANSPSFESPHRRLWWLATYLASQPHKAQRTRPPWLQTLARRRSDQISPLETELLRSGNYRESVAPLVDNVVTLLELFPLLELVQDHFAEFHGAAASRKVSFAYLMHNPRDSRAVKVGHANDVEKRRAQLSAGQACDYEILDSVPVMDWTYAERRLRRLLSREVGTGTLMKEHVELRSDIHPTSQTVRSAFLKVSEIVLREEFAALYAERSALAA